MFGYIFLVMMIIIYVLLQKIKFENMEVDAYRSEDQDCYNLSLGRKVFTFDNGNVRSRRNGRKQRKLLAHFESVEDLENMDWKTKWKIYRKY